MENYDFLRNFFHIFSIGKEVERDHDLIKVKKNFLLLLNPDRKIEKNQKISIFHLSQDFFVILHEKSAPYQNLLHPEIQN